MLPTSLCIVLRTSYFVFRICDDADTFHIVVAGDEDSLSELFSSVVEIFPAH
jgi:hypothetical protein